METSKIRSTIKSIAQQISYVPVDVPYVNRMVKQLLHNYAEKDGLMDIITVRNPIIMMPQYQVIANNVASTTEPVYTPDFRNLE